ncbi:MAG TPA: isoleucine--tRNA ligase [Candidatus Marinimicrobia bacterium]|nr:isoleucine--tRNA ligase [Candidatus Neomarinimicrobiota bacterium]
MYKPVSSKVDFIQLEHDKLNFWREKDIFDKLRAQNKGNKKWSFLDGPITANNPMGVHHAWGRTLKDVFNRYHSMLGEELRYQNGFDCQGLWVEVEVEKELGFKSKTDIEAYGIEKFVQACKDRVVKYSKIQTEQSKRLGYWMDWNNSYYTMADENNYTIWHFLKKCYDRGMIYKGYDVMPWCTQCGSAMSEHEIATEGYKELTHPTIFAKFFLKEKKNEALLVWTTTPWTLAANTAAAVHPDLDYVKVKQGEEYYILAKNLENILQGSYEIVDEFKGDTLLGLEYTGPFDELTAQKDVRHVVIAWNEVSDSDGTGIVHIAPGCGKEDFALSKEFDISVIAPIDEFGNYIEGFDYLTGKNVQTIAPEIFASLKEKGILYKRDQIKHRYPTCWRHGTELVFRLVDEWFISMDELRHEIAAVVDDIQWIPAWGRERELDWLRNMHDWMISKKRYWGLSLPIWVCESCGHFEVIGGKEELKERAVKGWDEFEGHTPHRPFIDMIEIACSKCGSVSKRIPDVGNPWLDAGIVPYSTMGYLSNRDYWKQWFPADFVTESLPGQFRNWFYSLLAMSTMLENKAPFKTLLGHALVKDEHGNDMHKSAGNAIWFEDAADKMGVDVMRWIYTAHNPENNLNFGYGPADEIRKKLLTLWNMYSFYITYADLDQYNPTKHTVNFDELNELDRWALSRINTFVKEARNDFDTYHVERLMRKFEILLDDLSNWYIRRSRRRFWKSENDTDKLSAYYTLYTSLKTIILAIAPVMPFVTEDIYQNLVLSVDDSAPESIHLNPYPEADECLIDEKLSRKIDTIIKIVEMGRSARNKANIRTRQPLSRVFIRPAQKDEAVYIQDLKDQILEELNIKEVEITERSQDFVKYNLKPNFKLLGQKLGKDMPLVAKDLQALDAEEAIEKVRRGESLRVGGHTLEPSELIIAMEEQPNLAAVEDKGIFLALDTSLTPELLEEGIIRDLVRHIQTMRKEANFRVEDRIIIGIHGSQLVQDAIEHHRDYLMTETLADELTETLDLPEAKKTLNLEKSEVSIMIQRTIKEGI